MSKPEGRPPEQKLSPWKQFLEDVSWDILFFRAFGNLLLGIFFAEGKAVKSGWFAFFVFTLIAFWGGCHYSERNIDTKLSGITNYFGGELAKKETEISTLKGQLSEVKQERDKYQLMLVPFEAMAIAKYTNAPLDRRLDLFTESFSAGLTVITNALARDKPILHLEINGTKTTSYESPKAGESMPSTLLLLNTNRQIAMEIFNDSETTAEHVTVHFMADIDPTNVFASQWFLEPKSADRWNHWHLVAVDSYGSLGIWDPQTIVISQNFKQHLLLAEFVIHADRSKSWVYPINLIFQN